MNNEFIKIHKVDLALLDEFIAEKTDYSNVKPLNLKFDVIFMSYNEKGADKNYEILKKFVPNAKRVNGVKGILNAYNACRELSETPFYYIVEGDSIVCNDFKFKLPGIWLRNVTYCINQKLVYNNLDIESEEVTSTLSCKWNAINPVNGEILPHSPIGLAYKSSKPYDYYFGATDADLFKTYGAITVKTIASIDAFNSSPYDAWKTGFRIGNKLAYHLLNLENLNVRVYRGIPPDLYDNYAEERLHHWESVGYDRPNGKYCIEGVKLGKAMAKKHNTWWLEYRKTSQNFDNLKNIFIKEYGTEYYNN